jgi:hypothetical protein
LELVGQGSGERNKQMGEVGYEAGTHSMAQDITEKFQSKINQPLEY